MTEEQIRQIVRDENNKMQRGDRFGFTNTNFHDHSGTNGVKIQEKNLKSFTPVSGAVTFAEAKSYIIHLNSDVAPSSIFMYGNVIGNSGQKFVVFGSAQLKPGFYLQAQTTNSVIAGGPQYPFVEPAHPEYGSNIPMQSTAYYGQESAGGSFHTLTAGFHIIDVEYPVGTIYARMTVTDFSKDSITLEVETLATGWEINANFIIT